MVTSCQEKKDLGGHLLLETGQAESPSTERRSARSAMPANDSLKTAWRDPTHFEIVGDKRIYQHLSRFSAFARHSYRDTGNRGQLSYRLAATLKGTMPFASTQARAYDLTSALGAMDAITAVEARRE